MESLLSHEFERPLPDDVCQYEELRGEAEFAVEPYDLLNSVITDLQLAPRDTTGKVHFTADVRILRPAEPARGNRGIFLDVVNRGRSVFERTLDRDFLLQRGFTVVTCGWQHDVPRGGGLFGMSAPVTGAGFMALRDLLVCLRNDGYEFAIALGGSQSGRLLRQLVYLGMCEAETGGLAIDGLLAVAAGPRMTEANLRDGEPSSNGPRSSMFPATDAEVLQRARARGAVPKLVHINTSSEYWSSAADVHVSAALCHAVADRDIEVPENVRMYLCASTQHAPAPLEGPVDSRGVYPPNTIDYKPFVRAAVDNLTEWVTRDVAPPPSVYPRFDDGTLTSELRPALDADGNELGGLRHPDVSVPLGTYTGWNPSAEDPRVLVRALGATKAFSRAEIAGRYVSRDEFLARIREAASALAAERYVLEGDIDSIVSTSALRWDHI